MPTDTITIRSLGADEKERNLRRLLTVSATREYDSEDEAVQRLKRLVGTIQGPEKAALMAQLDAKTPEGRPNVLRNGMIDADFLDKLKPALSAAGTGAASEMIEVSNAATGEKKIVVGNYITVAGRKNFVVTAIVDPDSLETPVGLNKATMPAEGKRQFPMAGPAIKPEELAAIIAVNAPPAPPRPVVPPVAGTVPPAPGAPAAAGPSNKSISTAERNAYIYQLLSVKVAPDQRAAAKAKLAQLAETMPEPSKARFKELLAKPELFTNEGVINPEIKTQLKGMLQDNSKAFRITRGGKDYIVFGWTDKLADHPPSGTKRGKFRVGSVIEASDVYKADALDKIQVAPVPPDPRLEISGTQTGDDLVIEDPTQLEGVVDTLRGGTMANPQNTKVLGTKKGFFDKLTDSGNLVGMALGGILGFLIGGPIGAIIGLVLGLLAAGMVAGDGIFSDKAPMTIAPTDSKIQVRRPDGTAPTVEMKLPSGMVVTGEVNKDTGKFVVTDTAIMVQPGPGMKPTVVRNKPNIELNVDANGNIDSAELHHALGQPMIRPTPGAVGAASAPGMGRVPVPGAYNVIGTEWKNGVGVDNVTVTALLSSNNGGPGKTVELQGKMSADGKTIQFQQITDKSPGPNLNKTAPFNGMITTENVRPGRDPEASAKLGQDLMAMPGFSVGLPLLLSTPGRGPVPGAPVDLNNISMPGIPGAPAGRPGAPAGPQPRPGAPGGR